MNCQTHLHVLLSRQRLVAEKSSSRNLRSLASKTLACHCSGRPPRRTQIPTNMKHFPLCAAGYCQLTPRVHTSFPRHETDKNTSNYDILGLNFHCNGYADQKRRDLFAVHRDCTMHPNLNLRCECQSGTTATCIHRRVHMCVGSSFRNRCKKGLSTGERPELAYAQSSELAKQTLRFRRRC